MAQEKAFDAGPGHEAATTAAPLEQQMSGGPELPPRKRWETHPVSYAKASGNSWLSHWEVPEAVKQRKPHKGDFRDQTPPLFVDVVEAYAPVVEEGRWTLGLLDMWLPRAKYVKQSVHIPCWDSFSWFPWRWRGVCFGRTMDECWWTGIRYSRWARGTYAAGLGREYAIPEWLMPEGDSNHFDRIAGLCMQNFTLGVAFSMVVGMFLTCGGLGLINCAACYSCHAREKLRRRYNLPPAIGLPPGVDDCVVHFCCSYCASHQELRELVLRGVDGPGMHILDVLPDSFPNAPDIAERNAQRTAEFKAFGDGKPARFMARGPAVYAPPMPLEMSRSAGKQV